MNTKKIYSDEPDADYKLTLEGNNFSLQIGENFKNRLNAAYAEFSGLSDIRGRRIAWWLNKYIRFIIELQIFDNNRFIVSVNVPLTKFIDGF